jgi:hypothetical protein
MKAKNLDGTWRVEFVAKVQELVAMRAQECGKSFDEMLAQVLEHMQANRRAPEIGHLLKGGSIGTPCDRLECPWFAITGDREIRFVPSI